MSGTMEQEGGREEGRQGGREAGRPRKIAAGQEQEPHHRLGRATAPRDGMSAASRE